MYEQSKCSDVPFVNHTFRPCTNTEKNTQADAELCQTQSKQGCLP
jgi:hypothetical protein